MCTDIQTWLTALLAGSAGGWYILWSPSGWGQPGWHECRPYQKVGVTNQEWDVDQPALFSNSQRTCFWTSTCSRHEVMVPLYYIVRLTMLIFVCLVLRCKTMHSFCFVLAMQRFDTVVQHDHVLLWESMHFFVPSSYWLRVACAWDWKVPRLKCQWACKKRSWHVYLLT